LPLNETGDDPSPYNALSSCALNPLYLSLLDLPDANPPAEPFSALTQLQRVAFSEVKHQKIKWLHLYFQQTFPALSQTSEYQAFLKTNPWLENYALFQSFKDEYGGKRWTHWPPEFHTPTQIEKEKRRASINFHSFVQYHCFSQLQKVHAYAQKRGVFLKGDIPILVSPDSCDVWNFPSLFNSHLFAGAPPDYYNPRGQSWGFPLFDWDEMRRTHFAWWKQRLEVASQFFDLYRIDHVVGFFRIWGIAEGQKPIEGHFVPSDRSLWRAQGQEILEMMIDATPLLPIAEDLGTIPKEVPLVLRELGICGTKVLRWERRWEGDRNYIPYSEYTPFSMTTVSTGDTDILPAWWKNSPEEAIPFAHFKNWMYSPTLSPEHHRQILYDAHHTPSYFHINLLQEYLALFPELIWPNLADERINVPGTQLPTNWTYRFRPFLEDILAHHGLADAIRQILRP
jgi:4-alpha-glucanotransferase